MKKLMMMLVILSLAILPAVFTAPTAMANGNHFVDGINATRAGQGKDRLTVNGDLQRVAQDKANRMAAANTLSGDAYAASWKGGAQAVAADPAGRADVLLRNEFLSKHAGTTLNGNYGIIGVGEAVSANGTLFVAVNVAPKPYVPAPQPAPQAPLPAPAQGGSPAIQNPSNGGGAADNSAAVAEAEKRATERAQAEAKAAEEKRAEAEKKKQEEERKASEEAAAKKAEEEAEAKRIAEEEREAREAETASLIQSAESKTAEEAEAKRLAEERASEQERREQELRERITLMAVVGVSALLLASISLTILSTIKVSKNRPLEIMTFEEYAADQGVVIAKLDIPDEDDKFLAHVSQKRGQKKDMNFEENLS